MAIALAVLLFRNSGNLAAAYGIAVTLDMLITTMLTFFVIRYRWNYPLALCLLATGFFFVVDLAFFASNLLKLLEGGWFPLLIGGTVFTLMMTWRKGRELLHQRLQADALDLRQFLESTWRHPPTRVPGTAVFLSGEPGTVPHALLHNLKHNKVLHERNLFVTVRNHEVPWVGWTSGYRPRRWAATAGKSPSTMASRTSLMCRRPWHSFAPRAAAWMPCPPAISCRAISSFRA